MRISYRSTITAIGLCAVLGAVGACSSDGSPLDNRDAQVTDVSRDGATPNDTVTPDGAGVDISVFDTDATDTSRTDGVSTDTAWGDAPVDAPLSDRTSNDASSTDGASSDAALADAPADSTAADAPPTDSTPTDSPSGDAGNDPRCAPSYGAASGQQCTSLGLTCVYAEGACGCLMGCGALPPPDAGYRWFCGMRGAGCPNQKPTAGSPCSMDAQSCNYGTCCADLMVCENSAWKSGGVLCPP